MIPDIGVYLLTLIRCRKSNWSHVGSIPTAPTVLVAQVIRALVCGTKGRGFESLLAPYIRVLAANYCAIQFQ